MTTSAFARFLRLFLVALVAGGALSQSITGWNGAAIAGAIVAAFETAFRAFFPTIPAPPATSSSTSAAAPGPKV